MRVLLPILIDRGREFVAILWSPQRDIGNRALLASDRIVVDHIRVRGLFGLPGLSCRLAERLLLRCRDSNKAGDQNDDGGKQSHRNENERHVIVAMPPVPCTITAVTANVTNKLPNYSYARA